jgi:hypothetical protein
MKQLFKVYCLFIYKVLAHYLCTLFCERELAFGGEGLENKKLKKKILLDE